MRVRASALNYRDLMVLKGGGRGPTKIGVVPLSDGAGGPIKPDYLTDRLGANLDVMLAECPVLNEEALVYVPSRRRDFTVRRRASRFSAVRGLANGAGKMSV